MDTKAVILRNDFCLDPYLNLAAEEYLLTTKDYGSSDIIFFWRNSESVIIGKNQNAFSQINTKYTKDHRVKVVRRLTGGGAVFHDEGNLNYTFITDYDPNASFAEFAKPVADALSKLGVNARLSGRNDICVDGKKISGTAMCAVDGRMMFHGTLLYSADLTKLSSSLRVSPSKLKDKGIKSVKSRVANLSELIPDIDNIEMLTDFLVNVFTERYGKKDVKVEFFDPEDYPEVIALANEKYSSWRWNFGNSPSFEYTNTKRFPFGCVEVCLKSSNGMIEDLVIYGDFFGTKNVSELSDYLKHTRFDADEIKLRLSLVNVSEYILGATADDIAELFRGD